MRWTLLLTLLFSLVQAGSTDEVTVVLQNGLNSYEGCEDISIANPDGASEPGANNSSSQTLPILNYYVC